MVVDRPIPSKWRSLVRIRSIAIISGAVIRDGFARHRRLRASRARRARGARFFARAGRRNGASRANRRHNLRFQYVEVLISRRNSALGNAGSKRTRIRIGCADDGITCGPLSIIRGISARACHRINCGLIVSKGITSALNWCASASIVLGGRHAISR